MARTELDLDNLMLGRGGHTRRRGSLCFMEAVAWAAHEPHSDHPKCVSPVIGAFLRSWNDALPDGDRQRLKPYIPKVIGTNTRAEDEARRCWMSIDWLAREFAPAWLRLTELDDHARAMEGLPELADDASANDALSVIRAAREAAREAVGPAGWWPPESAVWEAVWEAAGEAVWEAAGEAVWEAVGGAAGSAAGEAAGWWAVREALREAVWEAVWEAVGEGAWSTWSAAREALQPTVILLQGSAFRLLDRMIAVGLSDEEAANA